MSKVKKGQKLEKWIAHRIELHGLGEASRTPRSGGGLKKGDVWSNLDFTIEVKNQKTIHILKWIDQAKQEAEKGNYYPTRWAVAFQDPRSPSENPEIYIVIDIDEFLRMCKIIERVKNEKKPENRELLYEVERAKQLIKKIEKLIKQGRL